jgi:hypothetical protein
MITEAYKGVLLGGETPQDWHASGVSGIQYKEINPSGDWRPYLPPTERQNTGEETSGCVTFSVLNAVETQLKFQGIEVNLSDAWLANASGTKPNGGNYLNVVADTLRTMGVPLQSEWDVPTQFKLSEFYRPLTQQSRQQAKQFLGKYAFAYEWISPTKDELKRHLKQAPLQIVVSTCSDWNNETVGACNRDSYNHAVLLVAFDGDRPVIFDSYSPFLKTLSEKERIGAALKPLVSLKAEAEVWNVKGTLTVAAPKAETLIKLMKPVNIPFKVNPDGSLDFSSVTVSRTIK